MALRKTLFGYSVFIDGVDYLGVATGFQPPPIEAETATQNAPGQGGPFELLTGRLGMMEATVSMGDSIPALEALCANPAAVTTPVLFVGALTDGETVRKIEYEIAGAWTKQERTEFTGPEGSAGNRGGGANERGPCTYTVSGRVFTHKVDGAEVRHVDLEQAIHRINGTDVLADLRNALTR